LEARLGGHLGSVQDTAGSGGNLTTTSVDSISVEGNIEDVEAAATHLLIAQDTFLSGLLESGSDGVLDFVQELALLGGINNKVGASLLGAEAPDLEGIIGVPLVVVNEDLLALFGVHLGGNLLVLNSSSEFITKRNSLHVDTVVLVGRLGEALNGGLFSDSLLVRDDGVTLLEGNLSVVFFEILETNLDVELTATSDNVLTGFLSGANNEGIGLSELAETFDELREIGGVLDLDGDTHDGGDRELHDTNAVSVLIVRDGTLLDEVGIDTDETDSVTARNIGDGFNLTSHHEDGTLNVLDVQVSLLAGLVVGAHDADTLASGDGTGEDTAESEEAARFVGGHHLGNEDHQCTIGVALLDGLTALIIDGALIEVSGTVALGLAGRGQLHDDHLKKSLSSVDPLLANALHEGLETEFLLLRFESDANGLAHLHDGIDLAIHNVTDELDDGAHDELNEAAGKLGALFVGVLAGEFLGLGVKVVVTPEFLHELLEFNLELVGVDTGETGEGESPAVKSGTEGNGTVGGVDLLAFTHIIALVSGNDNVSVLNDTLEVLIHGLTINLEFHDTTINLVDEKNGLNLLTKSLTKHSLGLHTDTFDVIDDDEGTISDTKGSSDLSGEIDVTG